VPRLCEFYPGICLTTEEKARKKTSVRVAIHKHTIRIHSHNNTKIVITIKKLYRMLKLALFTFYTGLFWGTAKNWTTAFINPLNPELNPICCLLALLGANHFLHVGRIKVKSLTLRVLMSYIYGAPILDVSRSHTTTQHSR